MIIIIFYYKIINYLFLGNQIYAKIVCEGFFNSITYLIVFILFSWDKVYYIIRKEGNEKYNYFRITKYKKCPVHNSYKCGCKFYSDEDRINILIKNYILVYKRCSLLFIVTNGKIKFNHIERKFKNTDSIPQI